MVVDLVKLVDLIVKKASISEIIGQVSKLLVEIPQMITDCFGAQKSTFDEEILKWVASLQSGNCVQDLKGISCM